jgi:alkylation response protein AidB-like acyl-CoA dehydrogenase
MGNVRTNATYYEDVRVPAENLVGKENGGWWLITTQLNHERIALSAVGFVDRIYQDVLAWTRATRMADGKRVIDRPWVQTHLARVQAKLEVLKLFNWQQAWSMTPRHAQLRRGVGGEGLRQRGVRRDLPAPARGDGRGGHAARRSPDAVVKGRVERMYRTT